MLIEFSTWVPPRVYFTHSHKQREQGKLLVDVGGPRQPGRDVGGS